MLRHLFVAATLLSVLTGCCTTVGRPRQDSCVGKPEPVEGLRETDAYDKALLGIAIGLPDKGKLCSGQEYVVTKPLVVYRVWDKSKNYSMYGNWWTFDTPQGPVESWRSTYEVCPEWGPRDIVSKCQLKVGTKIVIGPGQSMKCNDKSYPPQPVNQVFIPNQLVDGTNYVEQCEDRAWP